jgi:hypothetical protein
MATWAHLEDELAELQLVLKHRKDYPMLMSVAELLHEIEALPSEERLRLMEKLVQLTEADLPESLRQSMAEAGRGELIEMDEALQELDRRDLSV